MNLEFCQRHLNEKKMTGVNKNSNKKNEKEFTDKNLNIVFYFSWDGSDDLYPPGGKPWNRKDIIE